MLNLRHGFGISFHGMDFLYLVDTFSIQAFFLLLLSLLVTKVLWMETSGYVYCHVFRVHSFAFLLPLLRISFGYLWIGRRLLKNEQTKATKSLGSGTLYQSNTAFFAYSRSKLRNRPTSRNLKSNLRSYQHQPSLAFQFAYMIQHILICYYCNFVFHRHPAEPYCQISEQFLPEADTSKPALSPDHPMAPRHKPTTMADIYPRWPGRPIELTRPFHVKAVNECPGSE